MTRLLRCPNGHRWADPSDVDATTNVLSAGCPVCGAQGASLGDVSAEEDATKEMTLGDASFYDSPTDLMTVPSDPSIPDSERTRATIANRADEGPTELSEVEDSDSAADRATLPLGSANFAARDHTEDGEDGVELVDPTAKEGEGEIGKTVGKTEATAVARPTGGPAKQGAPTGRKIGAGATTAKRGRGTKLPAKVPGYEILGELGRGGMGVVYKARQIGLNRLCALKMILAGGLASADSLLRFKLEAEAIAHLQHPNIVQVYEIGEAEECPYFSLEFVDGTNLQNRIAATPQPPADTARLMYQICQGVHAAHQRGVLHRDLKPANVLMTKDGVPKITDFGLAKRIEEKDQGQTKTGAILGTPSYMAPEQAMGRAKDVGPAADIYSLGAVLYDMLTGRPPFRGETVMDTLNQVQKLEPLPPRNLVPKVPLDMQTICLKALQKEPSKRYATAGDMAEDLRRFLAGEPIQARPTPAWERGVKWAKRRPALATAISVSSVALVTVLTMGGLWLNTERVAAADKATNAEQQKLAALREKDLEQSARLEAERLKKLADDQRALADEQRALADKHFKQARTAVNEMLYNVGGKELRFDPGMELVRRGLVKKALDFYLDLLQDRDTDPSLRAETADADFLVGNVFRELGQYDDSVKHYQLALTRFAELKQDNPNKRGNSFYVAAATMEIAYTRQLQGQASESEKGYRQALDLFAPLAKQSPKEAIYKDDIANIYDNLGSLCMTQGRYKEAEANFDEALKVRHALIADGFNDDESRTRMARLQRNRATLLVRVGKLGEAEKSLLASRDIAKELATENPNVPDYASDWAASCMNLGICYRKLKRPQPALDSLREAIRLLKDLKTDYPRTPIFAEELGRAHYELGMAQGDQGQVQQAQDQFTKALEIQTQILAKQSNLASVRLQLAQSHISLGIALVHLNDLDDALKHYRQGVDMLEATKPVVATSPDVCDELARGHTNLAELLTALKKPAEADRSWESLLSIRKEFVQAFPDSLERHSDLAAIYASFATRYQKAGKDAEAQTHGKDAAVEFGESMLLADKDTVLAPERRKMLVAENGDNSLKALQQAANLGFRDANYLKTAPQFRLLRERAEFQRLVGDMEAKKN
jgi:eukaryotic-like serine/threonine-protein kinase